MVNGCIREAFISGRVPFPSWHWKGSGMGVFGVHGFSLDIGDTFCMSVSFFFLLIPLI